MVRRLVFAIAFTAFISLSGCAVLHPEKGIVAWNYHFLSGSVPIDSRLRRPDIPVTLRIEEMMSDSPRYEHKFGYVLLSLTLPVLGLFLPPAVTSVNSWTFKRYDLRPDLPAGGFYIALGETFKKIDLKPDEFECLLAEELRRSGLFGNITCGSDAPSDYVLRGTFNLRYQQYAHASGFGIFYLGLLPLFVLPGATEQTTCTARFEVIQMTSGRLVLAKNYKVELKYLVWFYNSMRFAHIYGEVLVPKLVAQFIDDLRSLPPDAWVKGNFGRSDPPISSNKWN
jgi:hypothetical protein